MRVLLTTTREHQHDLLDVVHRPILSPSMVPLPELPAQFDAVAYSSWGVEALRQVEDRVRRLYVVGEQTAASATGFPEVEWPEQQDFDGMLAHLKSAERDLPLVSFEIEGTTRRLADHLDAVSVIAYRTEPLSEWDVDLADFDWVVVGSPKAAEFLDAQARAWPHTASIGPTTSREIQALGHNVDYEPDTPSVSGIFEHLVSLTDSV